MKLIDKDALVAEIKRRKEIVSDPILLGNDLMIGESNAYFNLLSFLDTIEVKEVDLDKMLTGFMSRYAYENGGEYPSAIDIAKHFLELGLKAQKGE